MNHIVNRSIKISGFLLVVGCLILAGCATKRPLSVTGLATSLRYSPDRLPQISAHRGGGMYHGYPENCLESFAYLARQMPVIIECDIAATRDSALVMMHDNTYDRTTTGTGKVNDQTLAYARTLRLKDNEGNLTNYRIPTLDETLQWGRGKVYFTLDVKRSVPYQKVVEAVQKAKAENYAVIITYSATQAELVHRLDSTLMISVTIRSEEDHNRLRAAGIPDHKMIAFVGVSEASPGLYRFLHEKGILTILGTMGNLDKMAQTRGDAAYQQFVAAGADILSTDRPLESGRALQLVK